jgi:hypothetical protein
MSDQHRYEISILIGPCTQQEAEEAAFAARSLVSDITSLVAFKRGVQLLELTVRASQQNSKRACDETGG